VEELLDAGAVLVVGALLEVCALDDEEVVPPDAAAATVMLAAGPDAEALHVTTTPNCGTSCSLSPGVSWYVPAADGVNVAVMSGI
jgi:hypothetical protein